MIDFAELIPDLPNMMLTFSQRFYDISLKHKQQQQPQTDLGVSVIVFSFKSSGQFINWTYVMHLMLNFTA